MALNDTATLVINTGNFFTATIGTACPDLSAIPAITWENIGNTSLDSIFGQATSGGDVTVLGTLQNKTLRTSRSTKTDTFNLTVQQFDEPTLKLFYGSNMVTVAADGTSPKLLGIPQNPTPTTKAFLAVFVDQANIFALYIPKAEIIGGDVPDFASTESLAGLPLAITPVLMSGKDFTYAVTPLGTIAP